MTRLHMANVTGLEGTGTPLRGSGWLAPLGLALLLLFTNLSNHLLFHTLVELFSVFLAVLTAVVAWTSYPFSRNRFLMYLGCGYFWVGSLDLAHALTFHGMVLFQGDVSMVSMEIWVGNRAMETLLLLSAPVFLSHRLYRAPAFIGYGLLATLQYGLALYGKVPDDTWSPQTVATIKLYSGYLVISGLLFAMLTLWRKRTLLDPALLRLLLSAIVLTIGSELTFTLYPVEDSWPTFIGHMLKLMSFWLLFRAVVHTTLTEPFRVLARDAGTYDVIPDPTVVIDHTGVVRQANRAARDATHTIDSLGRHCHALFHPTDLEPQDCPVCHHLQTREPVPDIELSFPDGHWELISLSPILYNGNVSALVHISRDVTALKQAQRGLKQREERLNEAQRVAHLGSWEWEVGSDSVFWSDEMYRIFGRDPQRFVPTRESYMQCLHPDDRERMQRDITESLRTGYSKVDTYRIVLPKGELRYIYRETHSERDHSGTVIRMMGTVQDVTERVLAERALRESESRYRAIMEHASDGIVIADRNGEIVDANRLIQEQTGYSRAELVHMPVRELHPEQEHGLLQQVFERMRGGELTRTIHQVLTRDGSTIPMEVAGVMFDVGTEKLSMGIFRDIRERLASEQQLRLSEARLAEAQRIARLGSWEWDIGHGDLYWSPELFTLFGEDPQSYHPTMESFIAHAHPDDRERVQVALRSAVDEGEAYALEVRSIGTNGTVRYHYAEARPVRGPGNIPVRLVGTVQDISRQKEVELALQESRAKYRAIMHNASDAIVLAELDGHLVSGNRRAEQLFGYTNQELGALPITELCERDERECFAQALAQVRNNRPLFMELAARRKDGGSVPVEVSGARIDYAGNSLALCIVRDITERRQAEQVIRDSERKYRTLVENLPQSIFMKDADSVYLSCNRNYAALLGIEPDAIVGRDDYDFHRRELAEKYRTDDQRVVARGEAETFQELLIADGREMVVHTVKSPVKDDRGRITGVLGIFWDITEQKHAEDALRASQAQLAEAELLAGMGSWEWLPGEDRMRWSDGLYSIYRIKSGQVSADLSGALSLVPEGHRNVVREAISKTLEDGVALHLRHPIRRPDDSERMVQVQAHVVRDADGRPVRMMGTTLDVTERYRAEQELMDYKDNLEHLVEERTEKLQAANRELESFSYSVSHDLHAPLRAISGFSHALWEDCGEQLDEAGKDYLQRITDASNRMGQLIDGLLVLSRVIRSEISRSDVDLSAIAQRLFVELQEGDPQRRVTFVVPEALQANADPRLLQLLLKNLLENAWKFTSREPQARIELGADQKQGKTVYFVRDNGVGFDNRYAGTLFRPFHRLHDRDEFDGTGIGLATVQRIIQHHGGEVWAEGVAGAGACIYFTL